MFPRKFVVKVGTKATLNFRQTCAETLATHDTNNGMSGMKRKPFVYQCCIWRRTLQPDYEPTDYGWAEEGMRYLSLHSPSLFLLRQQQFLMLNSSDVLVPRRVHSKSKGRGCNRGRWHASTMVCMPVKVVLHEATNFNEQVNLETAVRLHWLWF